MMGLPEGQKVIW